MSIELARKISSIVPKHIVWLLSFTLLAVAGYTDLPINPLQVQEGNKKSMNAIGSNSSTSIDQRDLKQNSSKKGMQ